MEHFTHSAIGLLQMKLIVVCHDSGSVLPSMLEDDESVVEILDGVAEARNCDYTAHNVEM
mgnify:CR=1